MSSSAPCLLSVRFFAALAALNAITLVCSRASAASASLPAPVVVEAAPHIDLTRTDGGLVPMPGAENYGVFRASLAVPSLAEGKGYTYNHHPDLAVWHGRFYVAWDSGQKDEDTWPARELYSTSTNGREWSAPSELFPEGVSTPTRLYFFLAPNGRMLAFAGLRVGHEKTDEDTKGPMVVREIHADHTLGAMYVLRRPPANAPLQNPVYTESSDAGFVEACHQLLAARVTLETQDMGVFLDPDQRSSWHNAASWPSGKVGNGFWKAPSFYHRADGGIVGIGKSGWTSITTDNGKSWSQPVVPPTLVTNNAKVWGQRIGDQYVLVYNPTPRPRYPLAIVTGDDGITFREMRVVQPSFPPQRYAGINKNPGLQYIRGIAEWANDGSISDAGKALWLVYSSNKEDIWVSRIPCPLTATPKTPKWNLYVPKWSVATTSSPDEVLLESREPFDHVDAVRLFAPTANVAVSFSIVTPPTGIGAVDIELQAGAGGARPVRLRLAGDGFLRVIDRDKMVEFGPYAPGSTLALTLEAHCGPRGLFDVSVGGKKVGQAQFAEAASTLERLVIRVWARIDADRAPVFLPATANVPPELDRPAASVGTRVSELRISGR